MDSKKQNHNSDLSWQELSLSVVQYQQRLSRSEHRFKKELLCACQLLLPFFLDPDSSSAKQQDHKRTSLRFLPRIKLNLSAWNFKVCWMVSHLIYIHPKRQRHYHHHHSTEKQPGQKGWSSVKLTSYTKEGAQSTCFTHSTSILKP